MLFNSVDFAIFFPIVFALYWGVTKSTRSQNALILLASYFFYGWWDWRFLLLIAFSTAVDFFIGKSMERADSASSRRLLLTASLTVNLGMLAFFKYFNFFIAGFVDAFRLFGQEINATPLTIILPVGISFYTFQTLSYSIDIYRGKIKPTTDMIAFAAFVSFFPQLVAGPIERASNLLPQFHNDRTFDEAKATDGMRQILWGMFKKVVVADNCAVIVNSIFDDASSHGSAALVLGAVFFAFQIYGDFSGYSDIAIGTSRLLGFNLMRNFAFPYFSRDVAEFWRHWHISLSTWFRDYLYIPLGGSHGSESKTTRNVFLVFLISGLWHGANWTFLIWGCLHAFYFLLVSKSTSKSRIAKRVADGRLLPSIRETLQMTFTFALVTVAWVFFRAASVTDAFAYLSGMIQFSRSDFSLLEERRLVVSGLSIAVLLMVEWLSRCKEHGLDFSDGRLSVLPRWACYLFFASLVLMFIGDENTFIYFQF